MNLIDPDLEGQIPEPSILVKCLNCMNLSSDINDIHAFIEFCGAEKSNEHFINKIRQTIG